MVLLQVNIKLFVLKALDELLLSLYFKIANLAKIVCLISQESDMKLFLTIFKGKIHHLLLSIA
jgi:hypothetical protein